MPGNLLKLVYPKAVPVESHNSVQKLLWVVSLSIPSSLLPWNLLTPWQLRRKLQKEYVFATWWGGENVLPWLCPLVLRFSLSQQGQTALKRRWRQGGGTECVSNGCSQRYLLGLVCVCHSVSMGLCKSLAVRPWASAASGGQGVFHFQLALSFWSSLLCKRGTCGTVFAKHLLT